MSIENRGNEQHLEPTPPTTRIEVVDFLRGMALFWVLIANLPKFSRPLFIDYSTIEASSVDRLANWIIFFFAEGKALAMFTFLFGLGLAIHMDRVESRGVTLVPVLLRRMVILALIGAVHVLLLSYLDILILYAVLGVIAIPFLHRSPKTILIWACVFLALPMVLSVATVVPPLIVAGQPEAATELEEALAAQAAYLEALNQQARNAYGEGSFRTALAQRLQDFVAVNTSPLLFFGPYTLAMMLAGVYTGRRKIFRQIPRYRPLIRRVALWGGVIGIFCNGAYVVARDTQSPLEPSGLNLAGGLGFWAGGAAFCLSYLAGFTLVAPTERWNGWFIALAGTGRMALSNYLLQSLIVSLLFYNYGFGLYDQIGAAAILALAPAIFTVEVFLSVIWVERFRFGPAEWVWRSLTYMRPQRLRRSGRPI